MRFMMMAAMFMASVVLAGETVVYKEGATELEGYLAKPKGKGPFPAALIVHDWMGISDFTKKKADEMAAMGYTALAVDIYGKGQRPKDQNEAAQFAGKYKADRNLLRRRIKAGYDFVKSDKTVNGKKVVAFGYCFGGTTALELGRSGADLVGIATFHGGLDNPKPEDAKNIKGKVLVMHGAIDPYVKESEVAAFQKEMNDAKVDYQFISYSGAVHAFAVPGAGSDITKGAAYNPTADKRSWVAFKDFLQEVVTR